MPLSFLLASAFLTASLVAFPAAAIVVGLFGLMHLASALAFTSDARARSQLLRDLRTHAFGFREEPNGALTWLVQQEKVKEEVGYLGGALAEFCRVLGTPVVRLRAALPEELLDGDLGAFPRKMRIRHKKKMLPPEGASLNPMRRLIPL